MDQRENTLQVTFFDSVYFGIELTIVTFIHITLGNEDCAGLPFRIMSSPPTPTTSIRAASLSIHRPKHRGPNSPFPSIATLNPFRKKPNAKPREKPSTSAEPYEIAPGIWSTDATAKVFGYLDAAEKGEASSQSVKSKKKSREQAPNHKLLPARGAEQLHEEARKDTFTNESTARIHQRDIEALLQPKLQKKREARRERKKANGWHSKQGNMRTVSSDDQLVERGANPRTGLVSPFVFSEASGESLGDEHITVSKPQIAQPSPIKRGRSGRWYVDILELFLLLLGHFISLLLLPAKMKLNLGIHRKQDVVGWSLVESPNLSPIAQSMSDKLSQQVSVRQLQDRLLVEMPGVDNPNPENMTDEQIRKYQESVNRAYKHGGSAAMVNPETLPSPRQWTPEGPSTPPKKLLKIRRKEIGSGLKQKHDSADTVVVSAQHRNSTLPAPRSPTRVLKGAQGIKIRTPSNTPKGSSFFGQQFNNTAAGADVPFLGQLHKIPLGQIASATPFPCPQIIWKQAYRQLRITTIYQCEDPSYSPPDSPTLSQCLVQIEILRRSQFANLGTSSYRRLAQLLPDRLKALKPRAKAAEAVHIPTTITTFTQEAKMDQRPSVQRQNGSIVILRAKIHHLKVQKLPKNLAPNAPFTKLPLNALDSMKQWVLHIQSHEFAVSMAQGAKGRQRAERSGLEIHYAQLAEGRQTMRTSSQALITRGLSLGSVNIVQKPGLWKYDGGGRIHMYEGLENCKRRNGERRHTMVISTNEDTSSKVQPYLPAILFSVGAMSSSLDRGLRVVRS